MKRLALPSALLLLAACGGKSADECRAEATAVGDLLVAAANEPASLFSLTDDVRLVTRTDMPHRGDWRTGPIVTVSPTALKFGDTAVADPAALGEHARETFAKLEDDLASGRLRPKWVPEPRLVYFLIDPATPWDRVVGAVKAVGGGGLSAPAFLFEEPQSLKLPPRAPIDDKLDAIMKSEPGNRATEVAKLTQDVVRNCAPLIKEFGAVASEEGADKGKVLASAVAPALIACKCNADIPALRSVMFRILYVPRPLRGIQFDPDAGKPPIELPATTTWAEASKRFTPTMSNAELIVR